MVSAMINRKRGSRTPSSSGSTSSSWWVGRGQKCKDIPTFVIWMVCFNLMILWVHLHFFLAFHQLHSSEGGYVEHYFRSSHSQSKLRKGKVDSSNGKVDSSTATVIALARGYSFTYHEIFVGSLRFSGFEGNILLITEPPDEMDEYVYEYLQRKNVRLKYVNLADKCTTPYKHYDPIKSWNAGEDPDIEPECLETYPEFKIQLGRFPLMKEFLEECTNCTGPVLSTDFDVMFQKNPFNYPGYIPPEGLQVFEEAPMTYYSSWTYDIPLSNCKGPKLWKPRLSPGQIVGTRQKILEYYDVMHETMKEWMKDDATPCPLFNGNDHAIHQTLFYEDKLPKPIRVFRNREGMVNNVGANGRIIMYEERKNYIRHKMVKIRGFEHVIEPSDTDDMYDDDRRIAIQNKKREILRKKIKELKSYDIDELHFNLMGAADILDYEQSHWLGPQYDLIDYEGFFINLDGSRSPVVHQYDVFTPNIDLWFLDKRYLLYRDESDQEYARLRGEEQDPQGHIVVDERIIKGDPLKQVFLDGNEK